jgi:hypothetical protein
MISAFVFYIISFVIFYFSASYYMFVVAILFYAYGDAFRTGTHKAMIFEYLKIKGWQDQKVHYYGHTRSWSQMGSAVSALLAGAIVLYTNNYSAVFLFSVIPYVIDLILMSTYPAALDGQRRQLHKGEIIANFRSTIADFIHSFRSIGILKAILSQAVYTGYYKAAKDYVQPVIKTLALSMPFFVYLETKQRSAILVGIVFSVIYLLTSFTSRYAGRFAARFSELGRPLNVTMLLGLITGAASGLLFHFHFYLVAVVLYAGIYLVENLRKPIGISIVADRLEKDVLATALSAESQAETLFAAMLAPLLGFFADLLGVGLALFAVSLMLIVIFPVYSVTLKSSKS